jgi:hypothetical protein
MALPIVDQLIHPNDKRHHQSPHKEIIQQKKQRQYATTELYNMINTQKTPSVFDMYIPTEETTIDTDTDQQHTSSPTVSTPVASPVNRVHSSQPKTTSMTHADLLRSIGFLKPHNLQKYIPTLGRKNFSIQQLPRSPKLDHGETATMHSNKRNKETQPTNQHSATTWNIDIGFGPCTAIGGIKYTLLAVNKKTRQKLIYGLTNLKDSLLTAIQRFITQCGTTPTLIRTDFDKKLIGGKVRKVFDDNNSNVEASPP